MESHQKKRFERGEQGLEASRQHWSTWRKCAVPPDDDLAARDEHGEMLTILSVLRPPALSSQYREKPEPRWRS